MWILHLELGTSHASPRVWAGPADPRKTAATHARVHLGVQSPVDSGRRVGSKEEARSRLEGSHRRVVPVLAAERLDRVERQRDAGACHERNLLRRIAVQLVRACGSIGRVLRHSAPTAAACLALRAQAELERVFAEAGEPPLEPPDCTRQVVREDGRDDADAQRRLAGHHDARVASLRRERLPICRHQVVGGALANFHPKRRV
mmetsp:Transcript_46627/g.101338  ORF Transcript_46627/g.101338 Transcript_46627/m.101338 type:complete len:203 (-) Transcript_46627:183-791(-)